MRFQRVPYLLGGRSCLVFLSSLLEERWGVCGVESVLLVPAGGTLGLDLNKCKLQAGLKKEAERLSGHYKYLQDVNPRSQKASNVFFPKTA
jgi:hypothetical protein